MQAIILNRTQIYASARRRITLTWPVRLLLRIIPITLFLVHSLNLLQAIRCQTSPNYSFMKYGNQDKHFDLDFSGDGGILYFISSRILMFESEADSCLAVDMIPSRSESWDRRGSLSLLWPFFQSLCFGQFVETLSCALQGQPLMTETGMSIFEHSLAFAEAEGMLSNSLGLSPFGLPKGGFTKRFAAEGSDFLTRNALYYKLNTPPEVLLLALISALNNLSSQILGVLNQQNRFRLLNTGVWGLCFMSAFIWGFLSLRPESGPDNIILRIPTVCIVGFIPHLLILIGIFFCAVIYSLALLLCFISPQADSVPPRTLRERFQMARDNMQANAQLSNIRIDMREDFYTALLKIGFSALTVASEAVYLNEGRKIGVAPLTWLEEERLKEIEAFQDFNDPTRSMGIEVEEVDAIPESDGPKSKRSWKSGYGLQTSFKVKKSGSRGNGQRADGVGHLQRGGRYFMAYEYFEGIFWLFVGWLKVLANKMLDQVGVTRRPSWLGRGRRKEGVERAHRSRNPGDERRVLDFWMLSEEGVLSLPDDDDVDVAQETRKRLASANDWRDVDDEEALDTALYDWWKNNGWWGEKDDSGSYQPSQGDDSDEDDVTSIISGSTIATESDSRRNSHGTGSGHSTPTQSSFHQRRPPYRGSSSSKSITDHALDPEYLASLLNPTTTSARHEAQMLSHHLLSPNVTTRSRYAQARSSSASKLLTTTRLRPPNSTIPSSGPLTPDEEALLLEQMIMHRRQAPHKRQGEYRLDQGDGSTGSENQTWRAGGEGAGSGGPQCVVCQSAPRTVLVWPCRCLSLCEECRVSLAMNNFATCVCCRRDVVGFSRLYVP